MATITDLPCEVTASILGNLGSLRDLVEATVSCHHFYAAFRECPGVAGDIVLSFFDQDLLSWALAAAKAKTLPSPRTAKTVGELVDRMTNDRRAMVAALRSMRLHEIYDLVETQESIYDLAFGMAEHAWSEFDFDRPRKVGPSVAEVYRFCRAFYRTEIYFGAFKVGKDDNELRIRLQGQLWLVMNFTQFEVEQIGCVHDFLERIFGRASQRVLKNEPEFLVQGVDYCNLGDNPWKQRWISQGILFLSRLRRSNHEVKKARLLSTIDADVTYLWKALVNQRWTYRDNKSVVPTEPRDRRYQDPGPPSALDYANMDVLVDHETLQPVNQVLAMGEPEDDRGLRELAYVLWDMERMNNWDIWYQIDSAPQSSTNFPRPGKINLMRTLWAKAREEMGGS